VSSVLKGRAKSAAFEVRVTNRGDTAERMTILGTRKSAKFAVVYLAGGKSVTAAVLAGSYQTSTLKPGGSVTLTVRVTKLKGAKKGSRRTFEIRFASPHDKQQTDTVAAVVQVGRG
jgi:hypothetical protein